jgi:hypothetical protein
MFKKEVKKRGRLRPSEHCHWLIFFLLGLIKEDPK